MKKAKRTLGIIAYVLVFFLLFTGFSKVLMHKQTEGRWSMIQKVVGFYNEEPESFDVLFFGSSHIYCSLDPALFKEVTALEATEPEGIAASGEVIGEAAASDETGGESRQAAGLDSYVFASQFQPIWISYHYLVEALKTQKPKTVVLEINMLAQNPEKDYLDEGTNHTAIDPIPFSKNKLDMIYAAAPRGERRYYLFHIMKYHDRWEKLGEADFVRSYEKGTDPDKGFVRLEGTVKQPVWVDVSDVRDVMDIYGIGGGEAAGVVTDETDTTDGEAGADETGKTGGEVGVGAGVDSSGSKKGAIKSLEYIEQFIDLAQESGIEVILMKTPSNASVEEKMYYNAVVEIAQNRDVEYWDFNSKAHYDAMGLVVEEDFYDQWHLNSKGVAKFVEYLGGQWE